LQITPFKTVVETRDKSKMQFIQFSINISKYDYGLKTDSFKDL